MPLRESGSGLPAVDNDTPELFYSGAFEGGLFALEVALDR